MSIRLRITLLFSLLVTTIIGLMCLGIYYFTFAGRIETISTRLAFRAITTARLLSREETFKSTIVRQIDSLTALTYVKKSVLAYDRKGRLVYSYSDVPGLADDFSPALRERTLSKGQLYFNEGNRDVVTVHHTEGDRDLLVYLAAEDAEGLRNLKRLRSLLWFTFLAGTLLVWATGYFFSTQLLRPIRRMTSDVAEISAQNLARRLETGNPRDEWSKLAQTLNELLNRLQDSFEMQRRFISNASHELSTPLTSMSSQLEVALQRERAASEYRSVMSSIYQDVRHMGKLTQTLLEFAKASGDPGGLEIELIRIDEVLLRLPAEVAKISSGYSVKLDFDNLPEEAAQLLVYGNDALLFTAMKNIVVNACKYSPDHRAEIQLRASEQGIEVQVRDKGIGIGSEHLTKIFQPFFRVEENLQGGFGLGLSLARRIIGLHKGTIDVLSVPAKGTTFKIFIPSAYEPLAGGEA